MDATLHGPRVTLRTLVEADTDSLLRAVQDPEARRLTGTHRKFTRTDIVDWCRSRAEAPGRYDWAIVDNAGGGWLGECALNDLDEDNGNAGFRIALDLDRAGAGYGTEATGVVLDFAFGRLGMYRVELEVFEFNQRARRSYAKSGFVVEGVKRGALRWDGARYDVILMAALDPAQRPAGRNAEDRVGVR